MTAPVQTPNCTVGEIEELLANGVPVEQIARDLQEPRQNVVAVWDRWRKNSGAVATPTPPAAPPRPMTVVPAAPAAPPQGHRVDENAITVTALVAAAGRSPSKRTQALGARLADLANVVRERLAGERAAAEQAEAKKAEQEKARADIARLEAQLRAARAKLTGRQGGSPAQRDKHQASAGALTCAHGCGRTFTRPAWKAKHEAGCGGES